MSGGGKKAGKKDGKQSRNQIGQEAFCKLVDATSNAACNIVVKIIEGITYKCCDMHRQRVPA